MTTPGHQYLVERIGYQDETFAALCSICMHQRAHSFTLTLLLTLEASHNDVFQLQLRIITFPLLGGGKLLHVEWTATRQQSLS